MLYICSDLYINKNIKKKKNILKSFFDFLAFEITIIIVVT